MKKERLQRPVVDALAMCRVGDNVRLVTGGADKEVSRNHSLHPYWYLLGEQIRDVTFGREQVKLWSIPETPLDLSNIHGRQEHEEFAEKVRKQAQL